MRRTSRALLVALASTLVLAVGGSAALAAPGAYDRPGRNEIVSVSSAGKQAKLNLGGSGGADITRDGRYVVFSTTATGLARGDEVGATGARVYVRDRATKRTVQASVTADGSQPLGLPTASGSVWPTVSADGRYVAFTSGAINLVPGDTNLNDDIFVKDLRTGRVVRASVSSRGAQTGNGYSDSPSISADGRYVSFYSVANNLVPGDTNGAEDVFRHDLRTGNTVLVSANLRGKPGNRGSYGSTSISADGRYVVFTSRASDLVRDNSTGVDGDAPNVFRRDVKTGKTVRVSVASDGSRASFGAFPNCTVGGAPLITLPPPSPIERIGGVGVPLCSSYTEGRKFVSADGRYIVFVSNASNLVPNDTNYPGDRSLALGDDLFVHDAKTGRTERVSVDSYAREQSSQPYLGGISANGRYVHYTRYTVGQCEPGSLPDPLGPVGDLLGCGAEEAWRSYVYDRASGVMEQTDRSMGGKAPTVGGCASFVNPSGPYTWAGPVSGNGRFAVMYSNVANLAPNDTNNGCDFLVRDRGPALGVGGFGGTGSGSSAGPDETTCASEGVCLPALPASSSRGTVGDPVQGSDLIGGRVVPRPGFGDLFVRLDLANMSQVAGAPAGGLVYGLSFSAGGERYEVRAQRVPGEDFDPKGGASFGLFRQEPVTGVFTKVATLRGGYGTTGPSVVVAVPLKELGVAAGGRISDVRAFTGVGSYLTGVTKVLDSVRLAR